MPSGQVIFSYRLAMSAGLLLLTIWPVAAYFVFARGMEPAHIDSIHTLVFSVAIPANFTAGVIAEFCFRKQKKWHFFMCILGLILAEFALGGIHVRIIMTPEQEGDMFRELIVAYVVFSACQIIGLLIDLSSKHKGPGGRAIARSGA